MAKPKLITVIEAAKLFQDAGLTDISAKWVQDQIDRGKIPRVIVARKRRVRSDVIIAMIEGWFEEASGTRRRRRLVLRFGVTVLREDRL